ncbi:XkdX family protein [Lactobacillus crispatus]|uniref:XkdX family protein n=1 Tax=Lactobacillus crispatus TaxID=47770 RepID=UPI0015EB80A9|nr:XkdX family protein [Lactobacillus crispatus]MBA2915513.1 XkdX family protein [Lactobacillus crispatus]MBA2915673.1 XkdX family protein [Lactobacillus crispatus]
MLSLDLNFVPFDLTNCYKVYEDAYKNSWIGKEELRNDVQINILPASEYKKITGDDYEEPAKSAK